MKYVVSISYNCHTDFIAEGKNYVVNGESYVPITSLSNEAKRYKTYASAKRAANRKGANMWGTIEIMEVEA